MFKNSAPNYASAGDAGNFCKWHRVDIAPLRWMGCLSCGVHPRNKYLAARMRAPLSDKYEVSEFTLRIMSGV